MDKVRFGDVVKRVNIYVDRFNTDRLYYVGKGGSIEPDALDIKPQAKIEGATIGFKFHFGFEPGHILFMSRCFDQHKAATATFRGVCSDSTYVVETRDNNVLLQQYLQLVMQTDDFWNWCEEHKSGGVNFLINYSTLETYEFDLPSIEEQKVLADKLWAAYRVKEAYRQLLSTTDDMLKAKFQEMFGDGKYSVRLDSVCELFVDGDWIESKDQSIEGIRLVQTGNVGEGIYIDKADKAKYINEETFKRLNCTEIFPGDILISRLPDPIGRACIIPENLGRTITAVDCTIIRLKKEKMLQSFFISNTLTPSYTKQIYSFILGTTRMRISRNNLASIQIACPPIEEQKRFDEIYTQAEATKASLRASIEAIDRVIRSLINQ